MLPLASTSTVTFSGFVCVGMFTALGRFCTTVLVITGIVIRKMINSTSITSTSGVVLMVEFSSASSPSEEEPTFIAIVGYLEWNLVSKRYKRQLSPFRVLLANGGCRRGHRAGSTTGRERVARTDSRTADQVRMQVRSEVAQAVLHTLVTADQPVVTEHRRHRD